MKTIKELEEYIEAAKEERDKLVEAEGIKENLDFTPKFRNRSTRKNFINNNKVRIITETGY